MARIEIRMGGYGPPTTTFSRALKFVAERLEQRFGDEIAVRTVWNIMDLGYRADDIVWLVESGILTLGYQSSSYFTERVPELGVADLPFLFPDIAAARAAYDGPLGQILAARLEAAMNYRIFGWFENGFRHISNRLRPIHRPADMTGMRIRVLPSEVQARTFALLGAVPQKLDLTEAIQAIKAGTVDAQENPLANTVTYGVHKFHRYHTLSGHFYLSRPIFLHRPTVDAWPAEFRDALRQAVAEAIPYQRRLALEEERKSEAAIRAEGCEIVMLDAAEHAEFAAAVQPQRVEARGRTPREILSLLPGF